MLHLHRQLQVRSPPPLSASRVHVKNHIRHKAFSTIQVTIGNSLDDGHANTACSMYTPGTVRIAMQPSDAGHLLHKEFAAKGRIRS